MALARWACRVLGYPEIHFLTFSGILLLVQIVGPVSSPVLKWVVLCLERLLGGDVLAGGPRFLLSINHVLSLYFINDCVLFMCLAQDSASSVPLLIAYCVCMYELCVFSRCVMHFVLLGCMQSALQIKFD